jgi:hypothetical protein
MPEPIEDFRFAKYASGIWKPTKTAVPESCSKRLDARDYWRSQKTSSTGGKDCGARVGRLVTAHAVDTVDNQQGGS